MANSISLPKRLFVKTLLTVGVCFFIYLILNLTFLYWSTYRDIKNNLKSLNNRVINDLIYKNGKWDTSAYVNDNQIPQNNPLYILTLDGFVVDRTNPVDGFLDTSDFKYSSSFQDPTSITSPVNEDWRLYSKPLKKDDKNVGVIIVGYYLPEKSATKEIDSQLISTADLLSSKVKLTPSGLDIKDVDERYINVKIAFEIIDTFNRALKSVGGLPSYIDRSYLADLQKEQYLTIKDKTLNRSFLVYSKPIFDNRNNMIGIIVNGYPLKQEDGVLRKQLLFSSISGVLVGIVLLVILVYLLRREINNLIQDLTLSVQKAVSISKKPTFGFDKETGILYLYDKKIEVPVKTKQYYICKALFSKPNKSWENDEIMGAIPEEYLEVEAGDMYGSEPNAAIIKKRVRMIYDAIRSLNEKGEDVFGCDIIILQGKTYRINPSVQQHDRASTS